MTAIAKPGLDVQGSAYIDVVFDGPPDHQAGRFVEVEDATGKSIRAGQWIQRTDGYWTLRIAKPQINAELLAACKAQHDAIDRLFAMLIEATKDQKPHCFFPTQCGQPWEAGKAGKAAIEKAERP